MVVMSRLLPDHVVQRLATGPGRVGPITDLMSSLAVGQTCIICICLTLVFRCLYRTGNPVVRILIPYVSPIFQMQAHFWKICGV
ncbi:hypothetical protein PIB30_108540, partial [Stylosanthes scabra]|nr:hypothetical protein [Stylosanthes scabra]